jgi:hypothetical protein
VADASWERWRGEIAKACDGSHQTIETIEGELATGATTFLEADGCCFVVSVTEYPQARACQVWWAAGDLKAIIAALPDLHMWASGKDCTEMLVEGHPGWARALRDAGYGVWSVTLRKALHGTLQ